MENVTFAQMVENNAAKLETVNIKFIKQISMGEAHETFPQFGRLMEAMSAKLGEPMTEEDNKDMAPLTDTILKELKEIEAARSVPALTMALAGYFSALDDLNYKLVMVTEGPELAQAYHMATVEANRQKMEELNDLVMAVAGKVLLG